jgi:hypothetical protein
MADLDIEREPEGLSYPQVTDEERLRRVAAALAEGPPPCSTCGKPTVFDAAVCGLTVGGLWLKGWHMCPNHHGTLASGLAEVCEAPTWSVAKGGRSVELGTGRLRFGAVKLESGERLDVHGLMTRIARLPELERLAVAVEAWMGAATGHDTLEHDALVDAWNGYQERRAESNSPGQGEEDASR